MYDDADSLFGSPYNGNIHWPSRIVSAPELSRKGILKKSNENILSNNNSNKEDKLSNDIDAEQPVTEKTCGTDLLTDSPKVSSFFFLKLSMFI